MKDMPYDMIFEYLQITFPTDWKNIIFYAVLSPDSYSMKYYIEQAEGKYIDCFSISSINRTILNRSFMNIYNILNTYRKSLPEKECWSSIILYIDVNGKFTAKFGYDDIHLSWQQRIDRIENNLFK